MINIPCKLAVLALAATAIPAAAKGDEILSKFMAEGAAKKMGGYRPNSARMNEDDSVVKVAPEGLEAPKYGILKYAGNSWAFILDEREDGHKLFVDTNRDGDLTNDRETTWKTKQVGEFRQFSGTASIALDEQRNGAIGLYMFDPKDDRRASLKGRLFFYADFGAEYTFELDGKEFSVFEAGFPTTQSSYAIDRDGNGQISAKLERARIDKPFNFTGTTYVFKLEDGKLLLEKAEEELEQAPLPPDLSVGKPALEFTATTLSGKEVNFPKDFAGSIVMLDCWATWCGPCIREIPNMKEAYAKWHEEGFEILGVSFDSKGKDEAVKEFLETQELPWPQIFEGKGWNNAVGRMHDVSGIPFVLLVDGDSGNIIATERSLRGEGLADFIGKQLKAKNGTPNEEHTQEENAELVEESPGGDADDSLK